MKWTQQRAREAVVVLPFIVLLSAIVWGPTLGHKFVWDDDYFVVSNPALRSWSAIPSYFTDISTMAGAGYATQFAVFRPVRNISYLLDFKAAGLNPWWWHLHNVVLHTGNAFLVFLVARRLLRGGLAPLLAGAVFLVHPVQSEVVAWVKCRDDLLAALFVLAAFLLWSRWRTDALRPARLMALTALYVAACLSKIQAVVLPFVLVVFEYWVGASGDLPPEANSVAAGSRPRTPFGRIWAVAGWLALVGLGCVVWSHLYIGHTAQSGYLAGSVIPTLLTMTRAGAQYVRLLVLPVRLLADYSGMDASRSWAEWRVLTSSAVLLLAVAAMILGRRRFPLESFGLAWVAICLLPVSNIVAMMQYMAERFMYLPMAGFALAVGALVRRVESQRPRTALAVGFVILAAYGTLASARAKVWKDSVTLFTVTVRDTPKEAVRPRRNLLAALLNARRYEEALPLARQLWEQSRNDPATSTRHKGEYARHLGFLLIQTGKGPEGSERLRSAIEADPSYVQPYLDLGIEQGKAGNHQRALEWFDRAVAQAPSNASSHYNRGVALRELGRAREAEDAFREAIRCGPDGPDAHKTLAALLWSQGRLGEAAAVYREALLIWPQDAEIRHWLDEAAAQGGAGR